MTPQVYRNPTRLQPEDEWLLGALMGAPASSIPDLAGWNKYSERKCRESVMKLQGMGYLGSQRMGNTKPAIDRYWVAELGLRYWKQQFGDEENPWGNDVKEHELLKARLSVFEQTYHILPWFIGKGGPNEVQSFRWLRSSSIHAVAEFDGGYWVMFIGAGLWTDWTTMREKWRYRFKGLIHHSPAAMDDRLTGAAIVDDTAVPSAAAVIAIDEWAAQVAVDILTPDVHPSKLCVFTPGADLSGDFVLRPSADSLTERSRRTSRRLKPPSASPSFMAIPDKPTFDVQTTVEEWPGSRTSQIAVLLGKWTGDIDPIVKRLSGKAPARRRRTRVSKNRKPNPAEAATAPELVSEFDGRHCLSLAGLDLSAQRDRIRSKKTRDRFAHFLSEEGKSRDHYWEHDGRVISMAAKMNSSGLPVAAGWRACWNVPNVTQIDPDFVVRMGVVISGENTFLPAWWYGEYERSATSPDAVADKLAGYYRLYDHLRRLGRDVPHILLICDDEQVEEIFWNVGRDLLLFTATYDRVLKGPLVGDRTVWLCHGQSVSIVVPTAEQLITWRE